MPPIGERPGSCLLESGPQSLLQPVALGRRRERGNESQPSFEMVDRFRIGETLDGEPARPQPVLRRQLALPGLRRVVGDELGLGRGDLGKALGQDAGHPVVETAAPAAQQGAVSGLLDERVLEDVGGFRRQAALQQELRLGEAQLEKIRPKVR